MGNLGVKSSAKQTNNERGGAVGALQNDAFSQVPAAPHRRHPLLLLSAPPPTSTFESAGSPGSAAAKHCLPRAAGPAHKSGGRSSSRRSRQNLRVASPQRGSTRPRDEQQPISPPPQKVANLPRRQPARPPAPPSCPGRRTADRPCCTFFASPAKAAKQESKNSSSEASRSGATPPARPSSSVEMGRRRSRREEREIPRPSLLASGELVVRTCKCGVHKEFSFHHSH
nr:uncharacterized protein LOC107281641 [Oryza sativa Japonica Group]